MIVLDSAAREHDGTASAPPGVCGMWGLRHALVLPTQSSLHHHVSLPHLPTSSRDIVQVSQHVWRGCVVCHGCLPAYLVSTHCEKYQVLAKRTTVVFLVHSIYDSF